MRRLQVLIVSPNEKRLRIRISVVVSAARLAYHSARWGRWRVRIIPQRGEAPMIEAVDGVTAQASPPSFRQGNG